jgi:hypothetical protein
MRRNRKEPPQKAAEVMLTHEANRLSNPVIVFAIVFFAVIIFVAVIIAVVNSRWLHCNQVGNHGGQVRIRAELLYCIEAVNL